MMVGVKIRKVSKEDIEKIMLIESSSFKGEAYPKHFMIYLLRWCGDGFYVAEEDGNIVGYICGCGEGESATIVSIAVHPLWRGMGVAENLLNRLIDGLKVRGVRSVSLQVKTSNVEAIGLYEKFGFRVVETFHVYYGDGSDAYLMVKTLASATGPWKSE